MSMSNIDKIQHTYVHVNLRKYTLQKRRLQNLICSLLYTLTYTLTYIHTYIGLRLPSAELYNSSKEIRYDLKTANSGKCMTYTFT
jgi:hypothetical protein